jgi:hypothetical protein
MSKWLLLIALLAMPAIAQDEDRAANLRAFRQELAAAVNRGSLSAEETKQYQSSLKTLDEQRAKKENNERVNRLALRKAMKGLAEISRSKNLKEEDRASLAARLEKSK